MNILQIAPQVPYPPDDGGRVGIYNITKHLAARGHRITLFALDRPPGAEYRPLRDICDLRTTSYSTGNTLAGAFFNIFTDFPYTVSKYRSPEFMHRILEFIKANPVDVVHVDHLHMAGYGLALKKKFGVPVVLREHNVESVIMGRFADHARNPFLKSYARLQQRRLTRYESAAVGGFDVCCPITPDDSARLHSMNPAARLRVIPGGVDASYFTPRNESAVRPHSIVFFGSLEWRPNHDAVRWFLDDIFPSVRREIPDATFSIVGKNTPDDLVALAGPGVDIIGYVEDLRTEIQKHAVSVAPFRIGGGMRLKIIESFAMGVPVVSTMVGCEGIGATDGNHLLVGDTPADFAAHVVSLLSEPSAADDLRPRALELARDRYRWEIVAEEFEKVYGGLLARGGGERG